MCAVSYVGEYWANGFPQRYPNWPMVNPPINPIPGVVGAPVTNWQITVPANIPTREEFEAVKKEIAELKELLLAAKKYDEATSQPDCHMDEKVALIKAVAKAVGVNMNDVFPEE